MSLKHVKERLKKLAEHTEQGDIICFVFPNTEDGWFVEWNDGKTVNKRDSFPTVEKALEFAESLKIQGDTVYRHRETNDVVTILDEWYNCEE
ncbi:TPA: hypothetical protein ACGO62_000303 [Streptococcus suis]